MDLDLKIANPQIHLLQSKRSDLDLTIFKGADLELKVKLDLDLNIAGFAHHWVAPSVDPIKYIVACARGTQGLKLPASTIVCD